MSSPDGFSGAPVIVIWGVGLIGGSLGMAWRRAGVAREVIGVGRGPLDEAVRLGAIDRYMSDPAEAIALADVLVLAAPVGSIIEQAASHARFVRPGAIVTDVGSTKEEIVAAWEAHLPGGAAFVGGHPMFGREVGGVANASPDLAQGCRYILTPGATATPEAVELVERLAQAAGGLPRQMSPAAHDQRIAFASHLPQLVATALAAAACQADDDLGGVLDLTAGGFRDTTRIAASPADLWADIFKTNPDGIRRALTLFREALADLEAGEVGSVFDRAHEARRRLP